MKCTGPIMVPTCENPVPCGKCLACRIAHRREWSMRATHELYTTEGHSGLFVTLTYDNNHLPEFNTLVKSDLQKFMKRLRKALYPRKIKYLAAGEYGDLNQRPHYHLLLYNVTCDDITIIKQCWNFCQWELLGEKPFGEITPESAQYVSGYIDKKYGGRLGNEVYGDTGRIPPFRLVSKGFGRDYLDKFYKSISDNCFIVYQTKRCSIPRYYCKRLKDVYGIDVTEKMQATAEEFEAVLIQETLGLPEPMSFAELFANHYHDLLLTYMRALHKDREARRIRYEAALKRRSTFRKNVPF